MASFISKFSKECDQCQKILDRSSIKTIRFESDMSTIHQSWALSSKQPYHQLSPSFSRNTACHPCSKGLNGQDGRQRNPKAPGLRPLQPGQPGSFEWRSSSASNGKSSAFTTPFFFRLWTSFSTKSFS
ncbi:hypothetical protein ACFX2I_008245 [Malus domestica]